MSIGVESSWQTHDSSTESFESKLSQEQEMDHQEIELTTSDVTHQSVSSQFKLAPEPISK